MRGAVRPASRHKRCPKCDHPFKQEKNRLGYICPTCLTTPKRFVIDVQHKKKRHYIYADERGQVLDSYDRADELLSKINTDLKNRKFDPSKFIASKQQEFYVSTLIERFLKRKESTIAPSYLKDYKRMLGIASEFFGTKDVREIGTNEIDLYYEKLQERYTNQKTIRNVLDVFRTFLYWCEKGNYNDRDRDGRRRGGLNILHEMPSFPLIETEEPARRWVSLDDQRKIFEMFSDADRPIIGFLMLHGCRPGEARALRCKDVDLRQNTMTIRATFSGKEYRERRKGKRSKPVTIPIHPECLPYIEERMRTSLPEAYLFVNMRNGRYYSAGKMRRMWDAVRKQAGLPAEMRLYDVTRHSFGSNLANSGTPLLLVSKLMGHSNVKMTEKYCHADLKAMRATLGKLSLGVVQMWCEEKEAPKQASKGK